MKFKKISVEVDRWFLMEIKIKRPIERKFITESSARAKTLSQHVFMSLLINTVTDYWCQSLRHPMTQHPCFQLQLYLSSAGIEHHFSCDGTSSSSALPLILCIYST